MTCRMFKRRANEIISKSIFHLQPNLEHLTSESVPYVLGQLPTVGDSSPSGSSVENGDSKPQLKLLPVLGKVTEVVNSEDQIIQVALWLSKLDKTGTRWLVVYEPIESLLTSITVDNSGQIIDADPMFRVIFDYDKNDVIGVEQIEDLIPRLDMNVSTKQHLSAQSKNGYCFPVSVDLTPLTEGIVVTVTVFTTMSGLLLVDSDGEILACNNQFSTLLFGHGRDLVMKENVSKLLPDFFNLIIECEYRDVPMTSSFNFDWSSSVNSANRDSALDFGQLELTAVRSAVTSPSNSCNACHTSKNMVYFSEPECSNVLGTPLLENEDQNLSKSERSIDSYTRNVISASFGTMDLNGKCESPPPVSTSDPKLSQCMTSRKMATLMPRQPIDLDTSFTSHPQNTSTPERSSGGPNLWKGCVKHQLSKSLLGPQGALSFFTHALHKDNFLIPVGVEIRYVPEAGIFYVWITRNSDVLNGPFDYFSKPSRNNSPRKSSNKVRHVQSKNSFRLKSSPFLAMDSDQGSGSSKKVQQKPFSLSDLCFESESSEMLTGEYASLYNTICEIGTGAFGVVKLSARKVDDLLVVTKCIDRSKILEDGWDSVGSSSNGDQASHMPREIVLLKKLKHPNIVRLIDVFENDNWFQLVMEKHGSGIDLFEFIDRQPQIDEPLASFMFRQIVSAVCYLFDELNLIHRDIKDENVIINEKFQCKLIDFGSAAYLEQGKTFGSFCGTMEYCSPEVLMGSRYEGPPQEVWALGVLLYTLVFGENPFESAADTIATDFLFPWELSEGLENLISWMLHPEILYRATFNDVKSSFWVKQKVNIDYYRFDQILPVCFTSDLNPPVYLSDLVGQVQK